MCIYLANESDQVMAKPFPLQLGLHSSDNTPMISIPKQLSESLYRFWRQSLFHDTFSVSLPLMEEMAFEEKFKYLIVTSHLLNDALSTHPKQKTPPRAPPPFHTTATRTRSATIGTVATLAGLLAAVGLERYTQQNEQQEQYEDDTTVTALALKSITPTITMALASGVSLFFVYRHLRRSLIRKLYQRALTQLQDVLEQSQLLDSKVHWALLTIQEIELVSRGYRLSPITRMEQTTSKSTKRCTRLRSQLSRLLRRAFIVYEEAIIDLSDWVNKPTLARLFDMYNIQSVASLSAASAAAASAASAGNSDNDMNDDKDDDGGDDCISLDYLKSLAHLMHLKRRECMLQFLALSVMTGDRDYIRKGYETGWKNINSVLLMVKDETTGFVKDVKEAIDNEFGQSPALERTPGTPTHTESRPFIHRLSVLGQHLRTTEARVYLCNDELQRRQRLLSSTNDDHQSLALLEQQQQALKKEYLAMEKDIQQLATEWEAGRHALDTLLAPTPIVKSNPLETPPSPLPSPTMTPTTVDQEMPRFSCVVTSDESPERFHSPIPSKASVYESLDDNSTMTTTILGQPKKKSRRERINEMKQHREQEAKEKSNRMDSQTMVHELKSVLDQRVLDLDLEVNNNNNNNTPSHP
ncbi:unnamed protein product [Absidia cylindrospora]